ncbi:hypothetical protein PsYK624_139250 [Phanerochaete sordida]|uniref:Uncharacterized protein n=1 Tax=Phanerochaete sordida TaxID=48140 RepID=A0A9P3LKH7_9APHY|nr:hypothetical protein PsYK624_139250 [Phanerochaete sordida]
MDALLPEEILHEILAHNILVEHAHFLRFYGRIERYYPPEPTRCSDLLLVSKRWLRVGTPLLYECIKLSTAEHVAAVAALLRAHPHVGQAVRCLRLVDGTALGKELALVAQCVPKLQSIFINLDIKSKHSFVGLKKAVPLLRPANLIIEKTGWRETKKVVEVRSLVYAAVKETWQTLRSLTVSSRSSNIERDQKFIGALMQSSVQELVYRGCFPTQWIKNGALDKILRQSRVKRIICSGSVYEQWTRRSLQENGFSDADIQRFTFVQDSMDVLHMRLRRTAEGDTTAALITDVQEF